MGWGLGPIERSISGWKWKGLKSLTLPTPRDETLEVDTKLRPTEEGGRRRGGFTTEGTEKL